MALDVVSQTISRVITARPVLFQALHHDPVQVASDQAKELGRFEAASLCDRAQFGVDESAQAGGWPDGIVFANNAADFIQAGLMQLGRIEGDAAREQFVK